MAKKLNKNRILSSKIALILTLFVVLFSRQYWTEESPYHELFEVIGVILTGICAMGRVYATAYLGGNKNEKLITHGIYSVVRNPLYFFSLIGITGVSLMSNHIVIMIALPSFFAFLYTGLIDREQEFLREKFGDDYKAYAKKIHAMIPSFSNYSAPEQILVQPRFLTKAMQDAIWWLAALPIIELCEYLQEQHIIPTFFVG